MQVRIVRVVTDPIKNQTNIKPDGWPYGRQDDEAIAELIPYTNGVSGLPDPIIKWAPMKWTHMSTAHRMGYRVQDVATSELVNIPNLSPA